MSTVIMAIMVLFVLLAPITTRYGVNEAIFKAEPGSPNSYLSPRSEAWFGTDDIGRDIYSRMIFGLRVSLIIGIRPRILATLVGVTVGSYAGLHGRAVRRPDDACHRHLPGLSVPRRVARRAQLPRRTRLPRRRSSVNGPRSDSSSCCSSIFGWMGVARLVRGSVLALKEREFVEAARALGASNSEHRVPASAPQLDRSDPGGAHQHRGRRRSSARRRCRSSGSAPTPDPVIRHSGCWCRLPDGRSLPGSGGWSSSHAPCLVLVALTSTSSVTVSETPPIPSWSTGADMTESVLSLRDFRVSFPTLNGTVQAVRGVDLDVGRGRDGRRRRRVRLRASR